MNLKEKLAELELPHGSYIVVGSGILGALGIRESNDIDLVVSSEVFQRLGAEGWEQGRWGNDIVHKKDIFDVCDRWYGQSVDDLLRHAQVLGGIPYMSLSNVYDWKKNRGLEKDKRDAVLIEAFRQNAQGVIPRKEKLDQNDHLIRVSLKAVILNQQGQVLVVKESGRDWWDIPGGGIDHGETIREALTRELVEEVSLKGDFEYKALLAEDPRYLRGLNLYQMRITFLVKPESMVFAPGEDADEVQFVDADSFKDSELWSERQIYMFSNLAKSM